MGDRIKDKMFTFLASPWVIGTALWIPTCAYIFSNVIPGGDPRNQPASFAALALVPIVVVLLLVRRYQARKVALNLAEVAVDHLKACGTASSMGSLYKTSLSREMGASVDYESFCNALLASRNVTREGTRMVMGSKQVMLRYSS